MSSQRTLILATSASILVGLALLYIIDQRRKKKNPALKSPSVSNQNGSKVSSSNPPSIKPGFQDSTIQTHPSVAEDIIESVIGPSSNSIPSSGDCSTESFESVDKSDCEANGTEFPRKENSKNSNNGGIEFSTDQKSEVKANPLPQALSADDPTLISGDFQSDSIVVVPGKIPYQEFTGATTLTSHQVENVKIEIVTPQIISDSHPSGPEDIESQIDAGSILGVVLDPVPFDSSPLEDVQEAKADEHDLTWVPDADTDDIFSDQSTTLRDDDDSIWSHSVTTDGNSGSDDGNGVNLSMVTSGEDFSWVNKTEETENSTKEEQPYGDSANPPKKVKLDPVPEMEASTEF